MDEQEKVVATKVDYSARVAKARETRLRKIKEAQERAAQAAARKAAKEQAASQETETAAQPAPAIDAPPLKKATTPWKPARVLDIPEHLKDPRFTYRFVASLRVGNELKKQQEGWEYDHELARKMRELYGGGQRTLNDGTPLDSTFKVRELIVMRIPKEMAASRNKYYTDRANRAFSDYRNQLKQNITQEGSQAPVYGNVEEEKAFVRRT